MVNRAAQRATAGALPGRLRSSFAAAGCAVVLGLAGCSGSDMGIEMNGKIFDAVGLSGQAKKASEPKLAERGPLVPPPRTDQLPSPDSAVASTGHMAWPNDPDKKRAADAAAARKTLDKRCSDPMLGRPEHERTERDAQCAAEKGNIFSSATAWITGKKAGDNVASTTTDEGDPDPSVVTGSTTPAAPAAKKTPAGSKTR